jgi:hypothetical protein
MSATLVAWPGFNREERAVLVLQSTIRLFLQRNNEYWDAVEVALHLQAWYRGRQTRRTFEEQVHLRRSLTVLDFYPTQIHVQALRLQFFRFEQHRLQCAIKLQRWWQQCLCYDRLLCLFMSAQTETIEREVALEAERLSAAVKLQAVTRAYVARLHVQQQMGERIFEDEKWRIYLLREREAQQLQRQALPSFIGALRENQLALRDWRHKQHHQLAMFSPTASMASSKTPLTTPQNSKPSPSPTKTVHAKGDDGLLLQALGVDVLVDTSEIYSNGWSKTWGNLAEKLAHGADERDESLAHAEEVAPRPAGAASGPPSAAAPGYSSPKKTPAKVPHKQKQVSIAFGGGRLVQLGVGESHCVALDDCGRVYTWGLPDDGQLGYETNDHERHHHDHVARDVSDLEDGYDDDGGKYEYANQLTRGRAATAIRSRAEADLGEAPARLVRRWWVPDMGAGTSTHQVATKGNSNSKGWAIGGPLSTKPHCSVYVSKIAVGQGHTLALSKTGLIFAWGSNRHGQLGLGHFRASSVPTPINSMHAQGGVGHFGKRVSQICCGAKHSVTLLEGGTVLTWGRAAQLGDGSALPEVGGGEGPTINRRRGSASGLGSKDRPKAEPLDHFSVSNAAVHIACGWCFTVVLADDGQLWSWGNNRDGELGTGSVVGSRVGATKTMHKHSWIPYEG